MKNLSMQAKMTSNNSSIVLLSILYILVTVYDIQNITKRNKEAVITTMIDNKKMSLKIKLI